MDNYNQYGYPQPPQYVGAVSVSKVMSRVFLKMFLALLVTAATSLFVAVDGSFMQFIAYNRWAMWVLVFAELGLVLGLSGAINKISTGVATLLFYAFAVLNGLMLSTIFYVYTPGSIFQTFLITSGVFGAMAVYGYTTKTDLTKFGSFLVMALFGLIICTVVNIFLASSTFDWIISFAGVAIFIGLTAWDTQKIKTMIAYDGGANTGKIATLGALSLYLDFINLFLYLLRFFGSSRN